MNQKEPSTNIPLARREIGTVTGNLCLGRHLAQLFEHQVGVQNRLAREDMTMTRYAAGVATVLSCVLAATTHVSVQEQLPRAPGAHVVTIPPPGQTGSEPASLSMPMAATA